MKTVESESRTVNGWLAIVVLILAGIGLTIYIVATVRQGRPSPWEIGTVFALPTLWIFLCVGFFTLQPNMGAVLVLFGKYAGTVKSSGFHWANPLLLKKKVSLRAHNLNGQKLKVNDLRGNPIEIATVVVWRVTNTAQATFDVEDYQDFVTVQSEAALRHLAMSYPYDIFEGDTLSLRGSVTDVAEGGSGTGRAGGRAHRGGPHLTPCLCPRNRRCHAAKATGGGCRRRANAHRRRCGRHGRTGVGQAGGAQDDRVGRGTKGGDG